MAIPRDLAQAVRSGNLFSNRGSSVLEAPEPDRAQTRAGGSGLKRTAAVTEMPLRRERAYVETFRPDYNKDMEPQYGGRNPQRGLRFSVQSGLIPQSLSGRIAAGAGLLMAICALGALAIWVHGFLLLDEHFTVPDSASIQISGKSHLTRAQLLSVFGEDVDRNIFRIPLEQRRAELERLPWVGHATVMRLLPNRLQVRILERTPIAFVRDETQIGLVDANGVLFDLPTPQDGADLNPHYSFPVLTGISSRDPLSTRAARMKLYEDFLAGLDSGGESVSKRVSEVDLTNPDDLKAIVPDANSQAANVVIHFGQERYLERYRQYKEHLPEWRTQCPRLASVDMRYEQQVVLEPCAPASDAAAPVRSAEAAPGAGAVDVKAIRTYPGRARQNAARRSAFKAAGRPVRSGSHGAAR